MTPFEETQRSVALTREVLDMLNRMPMGTRMVRISENTGLPVTWLSRLQRGQIAIPGHDKLEKLHAYLLAHGCPASDAIQIVSRLPRYARTASDLVKPIASAPQKEPVERLTYTVPEAARALGISERSVYNRMYDGTLPRVGIGRRVVIPAHAIRALIRG